MENVRFTVVPLGEEHVHEAAALEGECFSDGVSPQAFAAFALGGSSRYFAALDEAGCVIGYGGFSHAADEAEILTVAVAQAFRRRGVARMLLDRMLTESRALGAENVYLEVRASNTAAQALYSRAGFHVIGTRKNYYAHPREDAVLMHLGPAGGEGLEC